MDPAGDMVPILSAFGTLILVTFFFLMIFRPDLRRDFIETVKGFIH